jgi:uncharacterized protein CbrC (UPF0167 family)
MAEPLPTFRYYPDPVSDGTLVASDAVCSACGRARSWIATSLLYSAAVPDDARFCPWCIADGSAVSRFGGTFNQLALGATSEADAEVEQRTPNFETWQDWEWPVHCHDGMAYLGQPRAGELRRHADAFEALRTELRELPWAREGNAADEFIDTLDPEAGAVAYLFRCLHCGTHRAIWDQD